MRRNMVHPPAKPMVIKPVPPRRPAERPTESTHPPDRLMAKLPRAIDSPIDPNRRKTTRASPVKHAACHQRPAGTLPAIIRTKAAIGPLRQYQDQKASAT